MGDKIIFIDSHELSEQELQHYSDAANIENVSYLKDSEVLTLKAENNKNDEALKKLQKRGISEEDVAKFTAKYELLAAETLFPDMQVRMFKDRQSGQIYVAQPGTNGALDYLTDLDILILGSSLFHAVGADYLNKAIKEDKIITKENKVIVTLHSASGLSARKMIKDNIEYIEEIIVINTPGHGGIAVEMLQGLGLSKDQYLEKVTLIQTDNSDFINRFGRDYVARVITVPATGHGTSPVIEGLKKTLSYKRDPLSIVSEPLMEQKGFDLLAFDIYNQHNHMMIPLLHGSSELFDQHSHMMLPPLSNSSKFYEQYGSVQYGNITKPSFLDKLQGDQSAKRGLRGILQDYSHALEDQKNQKDIEKHYGLIKNYLGLLKSRATAESMQELGTKIGIFEQFLDIWHSQNGQRLGSLEEVRKSAEGLWIEKKGQYIINPSAMTEISQKQVEFGRRKNFITHQLDMILDKTLQAQLPEALSAVILSEADKLRALAERWSGTKEDKLSGEIQKLLNGLNERLLQTPLEDNQIDHNTYRAIDLTAATIEYVADQIGKDSPFIDKDKAVRDYRVDIAWERVKDDRYAKILGNSAVDQSKLSEQLSILKACRDKGDKQGAGLYRDHMIRQLDAVVKDFEQLQIDHKGKAEAGAYSYLAADIISLQTAIATYMETEDQHYTPITEKTDRDIQILNHRDKALEDLRAGIESGKIDQDRLTQIINYSTAVSRRVNEDQLRSLYGRLHDSSSSYMPKDRQLVATIFDVALQHGLIKEGEEILVMPNDHSRVVLGTEARDLVLGINPLQRVYGKSGDDIYVIDGQALLDTKDYKVVIDDEKGLSDIILIFPDQTLIPDIVTEIVNENKVKLHIGKSYAVIVGEYRPQQIITMTVSGQVKRGLAFGTSGYQEYYRKDGKYADKLTIDSAKKADTDNMTSVQVSEGSRKLIERVKEEPTMLYSYTLQKQLDQQYGLENIVNRELATLHDFVSPLEDSHDIDVSALNRQMTDLAFGIHNSNRQQIERAYAQSQAIFKSGLETLSQAQTVAKTPEEKQAIAEKQFLLKEGRSAVNRVYKQYMSIDTGNDYEKYLYSQEHATQIREREKEQQAQRLKIFLTKSKEEIYGNKASEYAHFLSTKAISAPETVSIIKNSQEKKIDTINDYRNYLNSQNKSSKDIKNTIIQLGTELSRGEHSKAKSTLENINQKISKIQKSLEGQNTPSAQEQKTQLEKIQEVTKYLYKHREDLDFPNKYDRVIETVQKMSQKSQSSYTLDRQVESEQKIQRDMQRKENKLNTDQRMQKNIQEREKKIDTINDYRNYINNQNKSSKSPQKSQSFFKPIDRQVEMNQRMQESKQIKEKKIDMINDYRDYKNDTKDVKSSSPEKSNNRSFSPSNNLKGDSFQEIKESLYRLHEKNDRDKDDFHSMSFPIKPFLNLPGLPGQIPLQQSASLLYKPANHSMTLSPSTLLKSVGKRGILS